MSEVLIKGMRKKEKQHLGLLETKVKNSSRPWVRILQAKTSGDQ